MQTLTKGPIAKTLLKLALPVMASSFLGTLYNICDMAWVGTLGAKTVAGVGVGGMYLWLANGLAQLPRMGGQVLTAQSIGSGRMEKAKDYVRAALHITFLISILFGGLSLIFTEQMVAFFNLSDPGSITVANQYLRITSGLIIFSYFNYTLAGLYISDGDSKTPMIANFCGLLLNMILDPLLIMGYGPFPEWKATGSAVATVASQAVVLSILILRMHTRKAGSGIFKQNYLKRSEKRIYSDILKLGIPSALQSMAYCFFSMFLTRLLADFGEEAVAASRVGSQIESISWNTGDGFGSAVNSFTGQNYGAGEYKRIKKGYSFAAFVSIAWGMAVLACFEFLARPISMIFFHEELAIAASISYLIVLGISEPFMLVELVTGGALAGLGKTKLCSVITIVLTSLRIPMAFFLMNTSLGVNGVWWAVTISTILKGLVYMGTFFWVRPGRKETENLA